MKKIYMLLLLLASFGSTAFGQQANVQRQATQQRFSYRIIPAEASTYGYEIMINKKLLVRQKNIPGLPGNHGFSNKATAAIIARLVIEKLQKGMIPPTVTIRELDSLGILTQHANR